jgi:hypothetical protein
MRLPRMTTRRWIVAVAAVAMAIAADRWRLDYIRYKRLAGPPSVQGKVSWVDVQGEWLVFSLGHDDGIRSGHELNWIRARPQAKNLGRIRVIAVDYDQAIGRVIQRTTPGIRIQPGDVVAGE